jgi:hypothetical protein
MPFRSDKQRRFMWANKPEIAQRWADEGYGSAPRNGETHMAASAKGVGKRATRIRSKTGASWAEALKTGVVRARKYQALGSTNAERRAVAGVNMQMRTQMKRVKKAR